MPRGQFIANGCVVEEAQHNVVELYSPPRVAKELGRGDFPGHSCVRAGVSYMRIPPEHVRGLRSRLRRSLDIRPWGLAWASGAGMAKMSRAADGMGGASAGVPPPEELTSVVDE